MLCFVVEDKVGTRVEHDIIFFIQNTFTYLYFLIVITVIIIYIMVIVTFFLDTEKQELKYFGGSFLANYIGGLILCNSIFHWNF